MESTGQPGRVHISEKTYLFLTEDYYVQQADDYNGKSHLTLISPLSPRPARRCNRRGPLCFFCRLIRVQPPPSSHPSYLGQHGSPLCSLSLFLLSVTRVQLSLVVTGKVGKVSNTTAAKALGLFQYMNPPPP
jgi:hypothetical protein